MNENIRITCPTCNGLGWNPEDIQSLWECGMCCQCYGAGYLEYTKKNEKEERAKMLTVEYRVNGQLIGFTNIYNLGDLIDSSHRYEYTHITSGINGVNISGTNIIHQRNKGFERLVYKVLEQLIRRMKENEKEELKRGDER